MRPTPTEYKGTVFRSKAEAVFARCIDLSSLSSSWLYEPGIHSHDWDFEMVCSRRAICSECHNEIESWTTVLVEYKPSEPTRTYIRNLTEKVRPSVQAYIAKFGNSSCIESYVVYGNPWTGPIKGQACCYICYPIFSRFSKYGWGDFNQAGDNGEPYLFSNRHLIEDVLGITADTVREAMQYRFDLKNQSSAVRIRTDDNGMAVYRIDI